MSRLIGEFECKLDLKGRISFPSALKRQLPPGTTQFVMNRGFEECLMLYPMSEWEKETDRINSLDQYEKETRLFIRQFFRGATELEFDSSARLLFPKRLLEHAGIERDLILFAHTNKIEVWSPEKYEESQSVDSDDFARLAQSVMSKTKNNADGRN